MKFSEESNSRALEKKIKVLSTLTTWDRNLGYWKKKKQNNRDYSQYIVLETIFRLERETEVCKRRDDIFHTMEFKDKIMNAAKVDADKIETVKTLCSVVVTTVV